MSEPSREHVEAVEHWLAQPEVAAAFVRPRMPSYVAHKILTSNDPALLAALQDALVRHGWLTEEHREWDAKTDRARQHFITGWRDWREVDPPTE